MTYDGSSGTLSLVAETPTLPSDFVGSNFASEVLVSPNGRFVYAANRLHDSIAIFSVGASGTPTLIGEEWTRADYPRSFTITQPERFFIAATIAETTSPCFAWTMAASGSSSPDNAFLWEVLRT
jgi:6-phosphogluconolactonase (cycloisomerase 2 family)